MRKFGLIFIPLLFLGCDKTFENVIDVTTENYQVTFVSGIKDTIDLKTPSDSLLNVRLIFSSGSVVNSVHFNVIDPDDNILNSSPIEMLSITEVIYENQFILKSEYPNGNYGVQFSVTGFNGESKVVALSGFQFNNGQDNVAPVVSNLVMPDTIQAGETILFTIEASDSNGLRDIEFVFYETFDPNGVRLVNSQGVFQFPMFDDGNTSENGDVAAGDGIFTVILTFPASAQKGTWRFEFQARDRSKILSNKIIHNIIVL